MARNKIIESDVAAVASEMGIPISEAGRAVKSFFDVIFSSARELPFDNVRKIFSKKKFSQYADVMNIPSIGRIGPSYSRYLKWRANEAKNVRRRPKAEYDLRLSKEDIESLASIILSGEVPVFRKKRGNEMYDRVWLVGIDGKRQARQVIPKDKI